MHRLFNSALLIANITFSPTNPMQSSIRLDIPFVSNGAGGGVAERDGLVTFPGVVHAFSRQEHREMIWWAADLGTVGCLAKTQRINPKSPIDWPAIAKCLISCSRIGSNLLGWPDARTSRLT